VCVCVKTDGEDKSREKDCTVELNKSNDIYARCRGRKKGTGRDGPLALSLTPLRVPPPDHSIFTRVYVCVKRTRRRSCPIILVCAFRLTGDT